MIANFDLFDKQPNTMVGTPNDIYGEVGNQHFGVSPGSADPNYGYANTDMGGGMQVSVGDVTEYGAVRAWCS